MAIVTLEEVADAFGNGNPDAGMKVLTRIANRLEEARSKHPVFAKGHIQAASVIDDESYELQKAVAHESPERQQDEALDVAVTAIRFIGREWE